MNLNAFFTKTFGPSLFWLPFDAFIIIQGALDHWWFFVVLGALLAIFDLNALRKRFPHTRLGR